MSDVRVSGGGGWIALAIVFVLFAEFGDNGDMYDAIMTTLGSPPLPTDLPK